MGFAALFGIGIALQGASMASGVYANSKAAASQKRQALIAQAAAEKQAAYAISDAGNAVARTYGSADRMIGAQQADIAGAGFEIGVGTAADITRATNHVANADAIYIRENARRKAMGHITDAKSAAAGAAASSATAANVGTLLGGASSIASQWYQYKRG